MIPAHDAPGLLGLDSNRSEEATQSTSLFDLEEDLDRLLKIGDKRATAYRGGPIFDNYSNSDEKYSLTSTIPSSWSLGGLGVKGATACRETPILDNHLESDDDPKSFSGNQLGLIITSTP
jgi:hypothetical protein